MFSNNGETGSAGNTRSTRGSTGPLPGANQSPYRQNDRAAPVVFSQNRLLERLRDEREAIEIGEWNFSCSLSPVGKLR